MPNKHQAAEGAPIPTDPGAIGGRRKDGPPPCCAAAAPPPSISAAIGLTRAFEASLSPLPPTHRRLVHKRVSAGCGVRRGAVASQAPRARRLAPLLARSRRKREFCPFRQSFSASLRRRAHSLSKPVCGCGAGPARQTYSARGEEGRTQPRTLGNSSSKLGLQEMWSGPHLGSVTEPGPASRTARGRTGTAGCPGIPHHCQRGKPWGATEPETTRILPKASPGSSLSQTVQNNQSTPRAWDKPPSGAVAKRTVPLGEGGWQAGLPGQHKGTSNIFVK